MIKRDYDMNDRSINQVQILKASTNRTKNKERRTDEEQTKNDRRTNDERCRNRSRMWFGSVSALFSLLFSSFLCFLLLSGPQGTQGPFTSAFPRLFIAKQGIWDEGSSPKRANNFILKQPCSPRRAGHFIMKLSRWLRGWKIPQKWPFCLPFEYFAHFLLKRWKTLRNAWQ